MATAAELDVRLTSHEAVCELRYEITRDKV